MLELHKALKSLGLKGKVQVSILSPGRAAVFIETEYFGIWDAARKTFVD